MILPVQGGRGGMGIHGRAPLASLAVTARQKCTGSVSVFIKLFCWLARQAVLFAPVHNDKTRQRWAWAGLSERVQRLAPPALTPERLAQLGVALGLADAGIGQQAGIQARELAAADDAALPGEQGCNHAQRQTAGGDGGVGLKKQVGTECTSHGVILPLVAGLESVLPGAHVPPLVTGAIVTAGLNC